MKYLLLATMLFISCKSETKKDLKENVIKFENGTIKRRHFTDKNDAIQDTMWDYYSTGELSKIRLFKDNKQHGRSLYYLKEGQLYEVQHYIDGKIVGIDSVFHPNGKIKILAEFKDGKRNGYLKVFKENGELESEHTYRNDSIILIKE
ncbi:MAG: hypothetical protein HOP11_05655 [Saprospiraceae bacterium]|nr:hypothetical protein [Saprospiraceae bacterium]